MRRLWAAAALLALAACTGTGIAANPAPATPQGTSSGDNNAINNDNSDPGELTLAFGGDVHFDGGLARVADDPDGLAELRPVLAGADVAVVNLETAITDRGSPQPKLYHFRTSPQALTALANAGVDVVSLANNHAVDYGPEGLRDTLAAKAASPVAVVGIGADAGEAFAPAVLHVKGLSVAVIGSTQVDDLTASRYPATSRTGGVAANVRDDGPLLVAVRDAVARYDVVVAFLHWGTDYRSCPDARQVATATALEAVGVDVVVGGHAHRVQGSGWLGRAYVGYGLGNFVWNNRRGQAESRSGVLTVSVDVASAQARSGSNPAQRPGVVTRGSYTPLLVGDADGIPRPPSDPQPLVAAWEQARGCAKLRPAPASAG